MALMILEPRGDEWRGQTSEWGARSAIARTILCSEITFSPISINDRTRESSYSVSLGAVSSLTFAMQQ